MSSPQVINELDRFKFRLMKICDDVICPITRLILTWVTPDWDQKIGMLPYLKSKKVEQKWVKEKLSPEQYKCLLSDPTGKLWDITLIYCLLKWCKGLADKDDNAWSSKKGQEPECLISSLKNVRNSLCHATVKLSQKDFFAKTEEIRGLMKDVLHSVGKKCSHVVQAEIDNNVKRFSSMINEIRDANFAPETFDEYKKELFYFEQKALIREKGLPVLRHSLLRTATITPLSLIIEGEGRQVPVMDIFTGMRLEDKRSEEVSLDNLFEVASCSNAGDVILLKGQAGVGKTTLVKKITSDWAEQKTSIKDLSSFDLVFYVKLRDNIESFQNLLECSLGEVHISFKDGDLVKVVLGLRSLVILDGYDETNTTSANLFKEILCLNKDNCNLTVIVTTRPEADEKLKCVLEATNINAVHLKLVGIEGHKREEFVNKYFLTLSQVSPTLEKPDGILEYLNKTENKMSEVWLLPFNLCLLIILWMFKPDVVNQITTEAELYWQIFLMSKSKLKSRLLDNQCTRAIPLSVLQYKIEQFLEELGSKSLICLKENHINIPQSVYQDLNKFCDYIGVPVEELVGAFLKKSVTLNSVSYSFPHKGYMEFMAAYNIYKKVTRPDVDQLSIQKWTSELSKTSIPAEIQLEMLSCVCSKEKPTLTDILKRLHGGSLPDCLEKYQNLLLQTLSLFHVGQVEVPEATKIEALELLVNSGLKDKCSFLKVMHNIKCNDTVAQWIAKRFNLFDNNTRIDDSSFEAYVALLAATEAPLPNRDEINIDIILQDAAPSLEVLSRHLVRHQLQPQCLTLIDHFKGVSKPNAEETESIKILLSKDCTVYTGIWSPTFQEIPPVLSVRLPDQPSLEAFCESLARTTRIKWLEMSFSVKDLDRVSHPIPFLDGNPPVWVYVTEVREEDIQKVGDILRGLQQPRYARTLFKDIQFPGCSLRTQDEFLKLLDSLKGVRVKHSIRFPEDKRPDDEVARKEMHRKAKASTGCKYRVGWDVKK